MGLERLRPDIAVWVRKVQAAVLAVGIAWPTIAVGDNVGWYFSRANCLTANESLTWKIELTPEALDLLVGIVVPGTGFTNLGIPAFRRSVSSHRHRHVSSKNHTHQSATALVWTWRAHAGSFPRPEAFPYIAIQLRWRVTWVWFELPIGRYRIRVPAGIEPYLVLILDTKPWTVAGKHYERTSAAAPTVVRSSYARGCNWGDTFNSMGGS